MSESYPPQAQALEAECVEPQHELDPAEDIVQLLELAAVHLNQHAYADAEPLLARVLAHLTAQGDESAQMVNVLGSLATVEQALGKHDAAEQLWRRALAVRERVLGPYRFAIAQNLEHLADACAAQGKVEEALRLLRRALDIGEHRLAATNATIADLRGKIAELVLRTSQPGPSLSTPLASALASPLSHRERAEGGDGHDEAPRPPPPLLSVPRRAQPRWRRWIPRGAVGAIGAMAARVRGGEWPWLALLAGLAILVLWLIVGLAYRGGIAGPPSAAQAAQPARPRADPPALSASAKEPSRAAPRAPGAGIETAALRRADAKGADADRTERVASPIPSVSPQLAEALEATRRAATRQLGEGNIEPVAPGTTSSSRAGAEGATGAVMRRLIREPAGPPAAVGDNSRPAAIAPGSPAPEYPPALWSAGIAGKVLVEVVVDSSGRADLTTADVLYSDSPQFTRAVRAALPTMQFIPAIADGRPQAQLLRLPFVFAPEQRSR